jgi:hypothetical protein
VLVEANSASLSDLMTAVQTAAKQANVVSMSWGSSEFRGETAYDTPAYFANPNVTFVAASGDDGGAYGASWPAVSPYVVSVGGTTLNLTSSGTIRGETAWNSTGSRWSGYSGSTGGASLYESVPSYQVASLGSGATKRATPDVAAVANPSTGLSVYDSVAGMGQTGWFQVGGTSASSPLWAGIIAAADQARVSAGKGQLSSTQTLNLLYSLARSSAYSSDFHDVTSGSNFVATAKIGYDMVTGLGSPISSSLIAAASKFTATSSVANAATTVASNATTTTTTRAQTVAFSATTAAGAGSTSMQVFLSVGPVTTTNTSPLALAASAPTSASGATAAVPPARPAQSLPQSAPLLSLSASEPETVVPTLPETPSRPGLWLDPEVPREIGAVAPVLATRPIFPVPLWDAAVDSYLAEGVGIPAFELSPSHLLAENPATDEPPSPSTAALAGLAVAIWGTWEYRSRRSDRDPRRWSPARTLSAF